jgi:hypothetical protein
MSQGQESIQSTVHVLLAAREMARWNTTITPRHFVKDMGPQSWRLGRQRNADKWQHLLFPDGE